MSSRVALQSAMADVAAGMRVHYLDAGEGQQTAVLLHGFPQTSHQWRKIMPSLVDAGWHVIAPDYRGAGGSSKPAAGFDKKTIADDIHALVHTHLHLADHTDRITLVGHDIGAMVAIAYAMAYREEVSHLVVIDTLVPGTEGFDKMRGDPRGWHAAFHGARDVAEMLVQGRERAYLQHMIGVRIFDPSAIAAEDFDVYVRAYEAPGAMRAAFELYRTFDEDARAVRSALAERGKLPMPVLSIGGEHSGLGAVMADMMREIADRVESLTVPRSGHWIPEENPSALAEAVLTFVRGRGRGRTHAEGGRAVLRLAACRGTRRLRRARVGFGFDRVQDSREGVQVALRDVRRHGAFEVGQLLEHLAGDPAALGGERDHERAAIGFADLAGDQAAGDQPVQDAGQRRSLVGEALVQLADGQRARRGQQRQDVRFALRQHVRLPAGEIQADAMGGPMDGGDQPQRLHRET